MRARWIVPTLLAPWLTGCPVPPLTRDAGLAGVGTPCESERDCRLGLACDPATRTCQPSAVVREGMPCTLTGQCLPGLYCAPEGVCRTAGNEVAGGPCASSANCQRNLVCVRRASTLFGVCAAVNTSPDAGAVAQDIGGMCSDITDCLPGLQCRMSVCSAPSPMSAPGANTFVTCEQPPAGTAPKAYFELPNADGSPPKDFFRLPFPNDVRRDAMTGRLNLRGFPTPGPGLLGFDLVDRYARAAEQELDGFGTNQWVYFRFSHDPDLGSFRLNDTILFVDFTAMSPVGSVSFSATVGNGSRTRYLCENHLLVTTGLGAALAPGHTYGVILTGGIRTSTGMPFARDNDFVPMLATTRPSEERAGRAWDAYAPLRAWIMRENRDPSSILNAAVFTTQQVTRVVPALRAAVRAQPAPPAMLDGFVRCAPGVRSPCDDGLMGTEHIRGCVGEANAAFDEYQGQIEIPYFQRGMRPYNNIGDGAITLDAMGRATPQGTERVCVTVTIPKNATMPAGGWPTVLYSHGTGGNYRSVVTEGLAAALSNVDTGDGMNVAFATVGYEGTMHGARRGMGVTEHPNFLFFNFANPQAARDNVLQGAADIFALVRVLGASRINGMSGAIGFDPMRLMFIGHSQGGTVGLPALPYENDFAAIVLSGTGGDLRESLVTKRNPVDIASLGPAVLLDAQVGSSHPVLQLFQAYIERSDAVNYAPYLLFRRPEGVRPRPVLVTYGLGDTFSSVETMRAIAISMGIPIAAPALGGTMPWPPSGTVPLPLMNNLNVMGGPVTAALLQSDPMNSYDGHFVLFRDQMLQTRVLRFLATAARGQAVIR